MYLSLPTGTYVTCSAQHISSLSYGLGQRLESWLGFRLGFRGGDVSVSPHRHICSLFCSTHKQPVLWVRSGLGSWLGFRLGFRGGDVSVSPHRHICSLFCSTHKQPVLWVRSGLGSWLGSGVRI